MLYDIKLRINYSYEHPVDTGRHIVCLMPADLPGEQRLIAGTLTVVPEPDEWINRVDFFQNKIIELAFLQAYHNIAFSMTSRVSRLEKPPAADQPLKLSELALEIQNHRGLEAGAPHHFLSPSQRVPIDPSTTSYALAAVSGDVSVLQAVRSIGQALHRDMRYDTAATHVDTPMLEAFRGRRGVCQDFSHIMIACLRGIGIPAGYVSGYLRTLAPPGQDRLEGADALHAWVRAWGGQALGWVEFDPTNNLEVGMDHVVIARGRDYADVTPVKGIMRTQGKHASVLSVDVVPVQ